MMAIVSCAVRLLFAVISTTMLLTSVLILVALLFTIGGKERTVLFESTTIGYLSLSFTIYPYFNPASNLSRIALLCNCLLYQEGQKKNSYQQKHTTEETEFCRGRACRLKLSFCACLF